ncbi:YeiH family protein [Limobrevibacterium gyesilva]|uniref:Sulfate exporter family transporter n=1 Tax=Limobrevibacterium gyesilva TaxID=2991712 RepID=A0AA42CF45_9PROT|nr:putative sulfate exporter family transporter [Limobrevibacterium gyesilva]MCW3476808.1 putative sulfate exporter family transporter [Limobrevibacterium gyesilva]
MNETAHPPAPARAAPVRAASTSNRPLIAGVAVCVVIALVAEAAGRLLPVIGAPIIAIVIGVAITNLVGHAPVAGRLRIKEVSGFALRAGIVILGATLNLGDVAHTGANSLPLLALTLTLGLAFPLLVGRSLGVDWRMRCLIGMGTTICGASAIAALAPVLRAKTEEIAYSISVIFFFNMLAVIIFPWFGHMLHLSDTGFGLWSGTAVNDTSAVVAAAFAYSPEAGAYATIVKLTRTTLIIPLVLGFGLLMPWLDPEHRAEKTNLLGRIGKVIPWFIGLFVLASLANTLGLVGPAAPTLQLLARFVLVVALAAVGLQAHWRAFAGAGFGPLLLGLGTWAVVAVSSLVVQAWTAQL